MLRLRFERTNRRLPQTSVASAACLFQGQLSAIETGRLIPTPAQLQRLAAFFGVAPADLLKDVAVLGPRP